MRWIVVSGKWIERNAVNSEKGESREWRIENRG
jgi:hypothetical protein